MALPQLRDLAHAVADSLQAATQTAKVTARPYNYFSDDDWYIVPGTDWPAYSLPKLALWRQESLLLCALYVEKGVEGAAVPLFGSTSKNFDSGWAWNRIVGKLQDGELERLLTTTAQELSVTPVVRLDCRTIRDGSSEARDLRFSTNEWRLEQPRLTDHVTRGGDPCGDQIRPADDLASLARQLREPEWRQWLWLDLFVGAYFSASDYETARVIRFLSSFGPYLIVD